MADQNQAGNFEPIHNAHAIEQVVFVIQFEAPTTAPQFAQIRQTAVDAKFEAELPGRAEIQGFTFAIGAVPPGPVPPGPSVGTVYQRVAPNGTLESELRIEQASISFRTTTYTRWATVWGNVRKYFDPLLPKYAAQRRISGISVSYVDKFVWTGRPETCAPKALLREDSKYLCPSIFEAKDLWHSHTGAFVKADNQTKRLLNVNVDCLDEAQHDGRRVILITTVFSDSLNQLGYDTLDVTPDTILGTVDARMHSRHDFGKSTFGNLINDQMTKRIALID